MRRMITEKQVEKLKEFKNIKADEWSLTTLGRPGNNVLGFVGLDKNNSLTIGCLDESLWSEYIANGIVFDGTHDTITFHNDGVDLLKIGQENTILKIPVEGENPCVLKIGQDSDSVPNIRPLDAFGAQAISLFEYDGDAGFSIVYGAEDYAGANIWCGNGVKVESGTGMVINPDLNETGTEYIILKNLPTSDPHVAGALWNDNGTLKISAGA